MKISIDINKKINYDVRWEQLNCKNILMISIIFSIYTIILW